MVSGSTRMMRRSWGHFRAKPACRWPAPASKRLKPRMSRRYGTWTEWGWEMEREGKVRGRRVCADFEQKPVDKWQRLWQRSFPRAIDGVGHWSMKIRNRPMLILTSYFCVLMPCVQEATEKHRVKVSTSLETPLSKTQNRVGQLAWRV